MNKNMNKSNPIRSISLASGLFLSAFLAPAQGGILEAMDKVMRDYVGMDASGNLVAGKGIVGQGEAAWRTMSSIALLFKKAPEGSSRWQQFSQEFDAAFKSYAETYYKEGTLGGDMEVGMKALVKELFTVSNYIPSALKNLWGKITQGIGSSQASFGGNVQRAWSGGDESGSVATDLTSSEESLDLTSLETPDPTAAEEEEPVSEAGGPPPPTGLLSDIRGSILRSGSVRASGIRASGTAGSSADELFKDYVSYLYNTGRAKHVVDEQIPDVSTKQKIYPAVNKAYDQAARMEDFLVEKIVTAARAGKPALADLDRVVRRMEPKTARYYLGGVVKKVENRIKKERSSQVRSQVERLESTREYLK